MKVLCLAMHSVVLFYVQFCNQPPTHHDLATVEQPLECHILVLVYYVLLIPENKKALGKKHIIVDHSF